MVMLILYNSLYCAYVFIAESYTSAVVHQFQSSKRQSSSLFEVSSLPWLQHKSMSPGLFDAGDEISVSKPRKFYI